MAQAFLNSKGRIVVRCPTCAGDGKWPSFSTICSVCNGDGVLPDTRLNSPVCQVCGGDGKYPRFSQICVKFGGWGRLPPAVPILAKPYETAPLGTAQLASSQPGGEAMPPPSVFSLPPSGEECRHHRSSALRPGGDRYHRPRCVQILLGARKR